MSGGGAGRGGREARGSYEEMQGSLRALEKVEIVTLDDNYIDLVAMDDTDVVARARPLKGLEFSNSLIAEHGFSALVRTTCEGQSKTMLFDFGFSADVVARNADALSLDLTQVQAAALSHGHPDHLGGLPVVAEKIGKERIELVVHPAAYKKGRYLEPVPGLKIRLPGLKPGVAEQAGFDVVQAKAPYLMLEDTALFLGEIPRESDFERGMPNAYFEDAMGQVARDLMEDDSALVMHLRGKGLVVLSGCGHSGIVNTVDHAKSITGIHDIHVVMGGFHLTGPAFESAIGPTVSRIKDMAPAYVVPTHCTGRRAVMCFEREMPQPFVLNMAGTTLTFA